MITDDPHDGAPEDDALLDRAVPWDGSSPAVERIRSALAAVEPPGTLRLVAQRILLHERGRADGTHEVADAVADVLGNIVALDLCDRIDADTALRARLDSAWADLRADLAADGLADCDSIEVILDADGRAQVRLVLRLDVTLAELTGEDPHDVLHDGAWHVLHGCPELEEMRDGLAEPESGLWRRLWRRLRGR